MTINLEEPRRFVSILAGDPDAVCTWQTFDDDQDRKDPTLARIFHGRLIDVAPALIELNTRRAGVFICVNQTDLRGRSAKNIVGLRALFVDNDNGATLTPAVKPSIRVGTAHGEHLYWLLEDGELTAKAKPALSAMARHLGTDPKVADVARVLRVPGFLHCKGEPVPIQLLETNPGHVWTIDGLLEDLCVPPVAAPSPEAQGASVSLEGVDHFELIRLCYERMGSIKPAVEGHGGDAATYVACMCGRDFGLSDEDFWPILSDWNHKCRPPWDEPELKRKLANAAKYRKEPAGKKAKDVISNTPPPLTDNDAPPEVRREIANATSPAPLEPPDPEQCCREPGADDDSDDTPHTASGDNALNGTIRTQAPLRLASMADAGKQWESLSDLSFVPTPLPSLNDAIGGGLPAGQVTMVVGYTGCYKTEFARHCGAHATLNGHALIHVDVEIGMARLYERAISQRSKVPPKRLRNKGLRFAGDLSAIAKAREELAADTKTTYLAMAGVPPIEKLGRAVIDAVNAKRNGNNKTPLVILDSCQRLSAGCPGKDQRIQTQNFLWFCESLAHSTGAAVLVISEQKRSKDGGAPTAEEAVTSGAESRSIEFTSDVMLAMVPDTKATDSEAPNADESFERPVRLLIAKSRQGQTGYVREQCVFRGPCWEMSPRIAHLATLEDELIAVGDELGHRSGNFFAARLKRRRDAVSKAIKSLVDRGLWDVETEDGKAKWGPRKIKDLTVSQNTGNGGVNDTVSQTRETVGNAGGQVSELFKDDRFPNGN